MAAKKGGAKKGAKKTVGKVGKPKKAPNPCPNSPAPFFTKVAIFADGMADWATDNNEIEDCFLNGGCGDKNRIDELNDLCKEFRDWSKSAKEWADKVEKCWEQKCKKSGPPDHTKPPEPPF